MEDKVKYTLVFGSVKEVEQLGDGGDERPALKLIVRDRADNEVKAWTTSSMSTLDKLAELQPGDVFTVVKKSVKVAGRYVKGYDIEITGKDSTPVEEEPAQEEPSDEITPDEVEEMMKGAEEENGGK